MPYKIEERNGKWIVRNTETGKVKGRHDTEIGARRQINLLRGIEHGDWKPTGAPARK